MVKRRIIPKFLLSGGRLVKGRQFHRDMRAGGNPVSTARVYDSYGVDELILLDIEASGSGRPALVSTVERMSKEIFMPFTVGGGVRSLDDVQELLRAGADKVSINTAAVECDGFVEAAARQFGDQCVTVAIDYGFAAPGQTRVFVRAGTVATDHDPLDWALRMQDCNCGEILLCSIERDGTMQGYDLEMITRARERLSVPVIASSGAGSLEDCAAAFRAGADAIAIGSMFLFTDHSPIKVRSYLRSRGIDVRASRTSRN
jgi:imidazole glycerol-phosphate synthase subunit HisF